MPYAPGTCKGCGEPPEPDRSRCAACAAKSRTAAAVERADRRRRRKCITCGEPVRAGRNAATGEPWRYCDRHLDYYLQRYRERAG